MDVGNASVREHECAHVCLYYYIHTCTICTSMNKNCYIISGDIKLCNLSDAYDVGAALVGSCSVYALTIFSAGVYKAAERFLLPPRSVYAIIYRRHCDSDTRAASSTYTDI